MSASISRRQLLVGGASLGAIGVLGSCSRGLSDGLDTDALASAIARAESARPTTGRVKNVALTAQALELDMAGRIITTWAYGDSVPGRPIRAQVGDRLRVRMHNLLPEPTSIHWHGLAIRNDMDGVPGLTTPEIGSDTTFNYDFVVPDSGTHWFHPHHGLQVDRGLYAPLIVEANDEQGRYDSEWILVLDDWTDGIGKSTQEAYDDLVAAGRSANSMGDMDMGDMDMGDMDMGDMDMGDMDMGDMDGGDVDYSLYVINGRPPEDPDVLIAKPGQRVRLRIINASADSIFDVALAGHELLVTHSDGYPVNTVPTRLLRLGMGERYDALVTVGSGVFPFVATRYGRKGATRALIRTAPGDAPSVAFRPRELSAYPLTAEALTAAEGAALPNADPDSTQAVVLAGSMAPYVWTINGRTYDETQALTITSGNMGRLRVRNMSMMPHPLHLHGHTFQVGAAGGSGARKDTLLVPAMTSVDLAVLADNPGQWALHCHTAMHMEAGMMTRLDYSA